MPQSPEGVTIEVLPHAVLCPNGKQFAGQPGKNLCQILLENKIRIEHACEMSCACTTCHVIVVNGGQLLNEPDEMEDDQLDKAWGLTSQSRLACQAICPDSGHLVLELPKYTINHAREGGNEMD